MVKLEVFRGQIRINEKMAYFGLDYELTDEVGNLVDEYKKLDCENQKLKEQLHQKEDKEKELINYLKEKIKERDKDIELLGQDCYMSKYAYEEILSKIEKSDK